MKVVTDRKDGLFPLPGEIKMSCSCPDYATMCKHVAAVLYGVGARLDSKPELLFTLRGVDHEELIQADAEQALSEATSRGKSKRLDPAALGDVFGIDIDAEAAQPTRQPAKPKATRTAKAAGTRKSRESKTTAKAAAEPAPKPARTKKAKSSSAPAKKPAARRAKKPPAS